MLTVVDDERSGTKVIVCTTTEQEVRADFARLCVLGGDWRARQRGAPWDAASLGSTRALLRPKLALHSNRDCGQLLSQFFHWRHRVRTATVHSPSAHDVLSAWSADPVRMQRAVARVAAAGRVAAPDVGGRARAQRAAFLALERNSALLTCTHFRAGVAKFYADATRARSVLDFSAGWGDRLTGFLASRSVRRVVLIDPRPGSIRACRAQHDFVRTEKLLECHCAGAEVALPTLGSNQFDLVLSSPPYFDLERYGETDEEARGQIRILARTFDEYVRLFLAPVLGEVARVLRPGGLLVLNVADNRRQGVRLCEAAVAVLRTLKLRCAGTAALRKGSGFGSGRKVAAGRAEPVYVFRKVSR